MSLTGWPCSYLKASTVAYYECALMGLATHANTLASIDEGILHMSIESCCHVPPLSCDVVHTPNRSHRRPDLTDSPMDMHAMTIASLKLECTVGISHWQTWWMYRQGLPTAYIYRQGYWHV